MLRIVLTASHANDPCDTRAHRTKLKHKRQQMIPQRILLHRRQHIGRQKLYSGTIRCMQRRHRPKVGLEQGRCIGDPLSIDHPNNLLR